MQQAMASCRRATESIVQNNDKNINEVRTRKTTTTPIPEVSWKHRHSQPARPFVRVYVLCGLVGVRRRFRISNSESVDRCRRFGVAKSESATRLLRLIGDSDVSIQN